MATRGLFSHSGGLAWHAKAWFRHQRLWSDFSHRIAVFLNDWHAALTPHGEARPPAALPGLIICGPSAGWCLPTQGFLGQFKSLVLIDPDPLAQRLFTRRHPPARSQPQERIWISSAFEQVLPALLKRHPEHAILFCNVLGQLRYQDTKPLERIEFELNQLKTTLNGRHWASFHDRISGKALHTAVTEHEFFESGSVQSNVLAKRVASQGEWLDHLTENVLPAGVRRRFIGWPISPDRLHWVEAGWVEAGATRG